MTRGAVRRWKWIGVAFATGIAAYLAFGPRPPGPLAVDQGDGNAGWNLSPGGVVRPPSLQQDWNDIDPWAARPVVPVAEAPPPPPPAIPVAIVREGGSWKAVFLQDGVEQRAGAGEALYGGGQVRSVDKLTVRWVDAAGEAHERELLTDPVPAAAVPEVDSRADTQSQ